MSYGQYAFPGSSDNNPIVRRANDDRDFTRGDAPKTVKEPKAKRQRRVYPTDEIAHLWAHKTQESARNPHGNFYFEGDTIYSYGSHFPIARHVTGKGKHKGEAAVLLTTRGYSSTTSKHVWDVKGAIPPNVPVFHVQLSSGGHYSGFTGDPLGFEENFGKDFKARLKDIELKGRTKAFKAKAFHAALEILGKGNAYAEFFGLRNRLKMPVKFESEEWQAIFTEGRAQSQRASDAAQRAADTRSARRREFWENRTNPQNKGLTPEERLEKWLAGETGVSVLHTPEAGAYLRLQDSEVQTSQGARFPVTHAIRAGKLIRRLRASGQTYQRNGHSIHLGHYVLDSVDAEGTIRAGCHMITAAEFDRFMAILEGLPEFQGVAVELEPIT